MSDLKSVDEHNAERSKARREREDAASRTGVACPKCGEELRWVGRSLSALTYPPSFTRQAECRKCALTVDLVE